MTCVKEESRPCSGTSRGSIRYTLCAARMGRESPWNITEHGTKMNDRGKNGHPVTCVTAHHFKVIQNFCVHLKVETTGRHK